MPEAIFPTYSGRENRVTSTLLSVIRNLSIVRYNQLLSSLHNLSPLSQNASKDPIEIYNQVSERKVGRTVPDGRLRAQFDDIIETKLPHDSLDETQLVGHLQHLGLNPKEPHNSVPNGETKRTLFTITPDITEPKILDKIRSEHSIGLEISG